MKFSKAAYERTWEEYDLDPAKVLELAADALERPHDAGFWDDDLYNTHTLAFHTPDWDLTDEYTFGQANYRTALRLLSDEFPDDAEAATVGHWTYSRYQCIKVRVLDENGDIAPSFVALAALVIGLEDYPLLDDEEHSALEYEVWQSAIEFALNDAKREDEYEDLTDFQWEKVAEWLNENKFGYSEPNWVDEEWVAEAVEYARGEHQLHQEASLF